MRTVEELLQSVIANGGAMHSAAARRAGFGTHAMRSAVERGLLARERRSWLVHETSAASIRAAVRAGGRVTCRTRAAEIGCWVPPGTGDARPHVVVPHSASRLDGDAAHLHWARGPVAVTTGQLHDPVVNVLFHTARCLAPGDALCVWESAIRLRLVDPRALERIQWRSQTASHLAHSASGLSDSGLETRQLELVRDVAGPAGVSIRQQVPVDGHRVDLLVGRRLVVQADGFAHHRAAERRRDLRADARLVTLGYRVLRFDFVQLFLHPDEVRGVVAMALAQGLHR